MHVLGCTEGFLGELVAEGLDVGVLRDVEAVSGVFECGEVGGEGRLEVLGGL